MKETKKHIIQLIRENVSEIDPKADVILYGSRARGEEHSESDWDLLILTDYPISLKKEKEFRHNLFDLELEIEEPFSTFVYSKNDWNTKLSFTPFYKNVIAEGIKI